MRLPALFALFWCSASLGATISGRVTNAAGTGVQSEVRLWARSGKWFSFSAAGGQVLTSTATGTYTFSNVPAGDYLVDCRPSGGHNDRWFDLDNTGYVAGDADLLTVTATQTRTNVDIVVEPGGGASGTVRINGNLAAGMQVRIERVMDVRVHHNDTSQGAEHQGEFHMRGVPPGSYRIIVHDPMGTNGDRVTASPFNVTVGGVANVGDFPLSAAASDPTEPNNTRTAATMFTASATAPYNSPNGARIGPRGSDVDWYCTNAAAGDRYIARVQGIVNIEGGMSHESPWVDPVVAFYGNNAAGSVVKLDDDDDSGPLSLDALLDTGEVRAGPVCFAVSTFGDTGFTGASQGSAGDYRLTVTYGNRGPQVVATRGGMPVGSSITIAEGDLLSVDVAWSDPEMDMLTASWNLVGASGQSASMGSFNTSMPSGTFLWRAPQTAAEDSPYVLTLRAADADITRTVTVNVNVTAVNIAPTVPVPLAPADGGFVPSQTPALTCRESTDEDETTLSYDYEVYYGGDGGTPAETGTVVGRDGGWLPDAGGPAATVSFITSVIPENTHVRWRARAFDGTASNGHSAWSPMVGFVIDAMNDPPAAPVLEKPADGETVMVIRPTFSAVPPVDPEGDAYSLFFEVARDAMFTASEGTSPPVPVGPGATTMWTFDVKDLEWGTQYFARAWAIDARNGRSMYSNVNAFRVRDNMPPTVPPFITPGTPDCAMGFLGAKPLAVQVGNATDPEGDTIRIQLKVFLAREDPATATPAFNETRLQTNGLTEFDTSAAVIPRDVQHRLQARALDPYGASAPSECLFTVGTRPSMDAGMTTGDGGVADAGTGGTSTKGGCKCDGAGGFGLIALVALAFKKRRRAQRAQTCPSPSPQP
ncbi:MAG: carboxypeptidase regulatory-like domain-containing protein [Myxococcaceae bacterium]|nr:carboxypeptidase regulatory-like domain-containing protein [Myxococcaceae bacterium]